MAFEFFPNTNFHDLNLDYILEKAQKIDDNVAASNASEQAAAESAAAAHASEEAAAASEEAAGLSEQAAKNYADNIADPVNGIVTQWLEDHIDPGSGYALDTTLRSAAAAAPAFTVGDLCIVGTNNMLTTEARLEAFCPTKSIDDFPANSMCVLGANPGTLNLGGDVPVINNSSLGMVQTLNYHRTASDSGKKQVFIASGGLATRSRGSSTWSSWIYYTGDAAAEALNDSKYLGRYPAMVLSAASLSTVTGGTDNIDDFPANRLVYVSNACPLPNGDVPLINGEFAGYYFTAAYSGTVGSGSMQFYYHRYGGMATRLNSAGTWGPWHYITEGEQIYFVGPGRTYETLTQLWTTLGNDSRPKTVYVDPGEYDVFQEYRDAGITVPDDGDYDPSTDYLDYCVNIPSNTKLIGLGTVILLWDPASVDITQKEAETWSPVNVRAKNFYMENFVVMCANGRYCIHDDPHNESACRGGQHVYKNVYCYKAPHDTNRGYNICQGMGYVRNGHYEFINCKWENTIHGANDDSTAYAIGGHEGDTGSTADFYNGAHIVFQDCIMIVDSPIAMRFSTLNTTGNTQRIQVDINNTLIPAKIRLKQGTAGSSGQFFALRLLNSGNPTFVIDDVNNTFTPEIYNTWD